MDEPENFGRPWLAEPDKKRQKWTSHSYFWPVLICAPCSSETIKEIGKTEYFRYIIQFAENDDCHHLVKCLESTAVCLNAIYSLNLENAKLWKCFEQLRSELLTLIFGLRSRNNHLAFDCEIQKSCMIAIKVVNICQLYHTALNGLNLEIQFLSEATLFDFASTSLLLNVIGGTNPGRVIYRIYLSQDVKITGFSL